MPQPVVFSAAALSPIFVAKLKEAFDFHDRPHLNDEAAFARLAPQVSVVAASGDSKVTAEYMARLPALKLISVMGVGYDGVDVAAAKARGIVVTHTPDVLNDDVADLALALMLNAARQLPAADRYVREGQWLKGAMPLARKMSGARLGLLGMGRIGQAIAKRAAAFNMSIAYHSRTEKPELPYAYHATATSLAAASDFLVAITPGGEGTRKMVNAEVLGALGKEGIFVNVARGSVADEAALIEALKNGVIAGAGLDVFEDEPRVPQALLDMPHVVLAPHVGSATLATRHAMADLALANLQAQLAGKPVLTPVPECR
jgi:hydroxypyruvate reductase